MTVILIALSIHFDDGMALLATVMLSFLSTNAGLANRWSPSPNDPKPDPHSPPGDVVIKYPQGAFIVALCEERTARYLYFNPSERCIYRIESTVHYRALSLVSTLLLMGGVISLANARIELQTCFAAAYMIVNIVYWIGAALPPADHWNLRRLKISEIELEGGRPPKHGSPDDGTASYTEALWKAIAVTQDKNWIKEAGWSPRTPAWDAWLHEAESAAKEVPPISYYPNGKGNGPEVWKLRNWDFKAALSVVLRPDNVNIAEKS